MHRFGTPTRRAALAGMVAAVAWPLAARADEALEAAKSADGALGYGGASPGPVLSGTIGQPLRLKLVNRLDAATSFAWQGIRTDSTFPGLAQTPLAAGESRTLDFTPREPGFGLYGAYGPQNAAGLFGAVVVEEAAPPTADLDAVVVFSDDDPSNIRVNGGPAPLTLHAAPGARVRLRLANAAPDLLLALVASQPVQVIAIDGQPCEMFAPREGALPLAPSARFELMFDLGDEPFALSAQGRPVLRIATSGQRAAARPSIAALPRNPRLPAAIALEKALRATFAVTDGGAVSGGWPAKPLFRARRGQPVVLTLKNPTADAQTLRLEGHWARLLHGLDDGWDPYWRDALYIEPGRTLHVAFVADAPGKWPLASPSPAMRAKGLATWYQVA
jgi:FtsP/CotA-like multicopper oxidase with cupredoxin domain